MSSSQLVSDLDQKRKKLILYSLLALVAYVLFQILRRPGRPWSPLYGEYSLWTLGTSLAWFIAAELAFVNAMVSHYRNGLSNPGRRSREWIPWVVISGLFVTLTLDESLMYHERFGEVLDRYFLRFGWEHYELGQLIIFVVWGLIAAAFGIWLLTRKVYGKPAVLYYAGAMAIGAMVVFGDQTNTQITWKIEEISEIIMPWAMSASFVSALFVQVSDILRLHEPIAEEPIASVR